MIRALGNGAHMLHFSRIDHIRAFLSHMKFPKMALFVTFEVIYRMYYSGKRLTCQGISRIPNIYIKPYFVPHKSSFLQGKTAAPLAKFLHFL